MGNVPNESSFPEQPVPGVPVPNPALGGLDEEARRLFAVSIDESLTNVQRFKARTTAKAIAHSIYILCGVSIQAGTS